MTEPRPEPAPLHDVPNDLRPPRLFGSDDRREAVAELSRIGEDVLAAVTGVGLRIEPEIGHRRASVEVIVRLCATEGEPGPLDEGAVGVE